MDHRLQRQSILTDSLRSCRRAWSEGFSSSTARSVRDRMWEWWSSFQCFARVSITWLGRLFGSCILLDSLGRVLCRSLLNSSLKMRMMRTFLLRLLAILKAMMRLAFSCSLDSRCLLTGASWLCVLSRGRCALNFQAAVIERSLALESEPMSMRNLSSAAALHWATMNCCPWVEFRGTKIADFLTHFDSAGALPAGFWLDFLVGIDQ